MIRGVAMIEGHGSPMFSETDEKIRSVGTGLIAS